MGLFSLAAGLSPAMAQTDTPPIANDDIIVTATKRADATAQSVPLAITALGAEQLARQQFRSLETLAYSMPNVQLSPGGAVPGTANFTIRGLGVASTIPSIDPTVGLFIDGIYQGITGGSLFDTFDVESVEVLRGPQGLLFGKNVTGGAVLVRTTTPRNELYVDALASLESGLNYTAQAVVSGPIVKDRLQVKVGAFFNKDEGWFTNQANGKDLGGGRTWVLRGALRFVPSDAIELIGRYDHGENKQNDSPVSQNRARYPKTGHLAEQSTNEDFGGHAKWDSATLEANIDTEFGNGTITNLTGYRRYKIDSVFDPDGLREFYFNSSNFTRQRQWSEELRYAGTFGAIDVTSGLYYFEQRVKYIEDRRLGNGTIQVLNLNGGGIQRTHTYGIFGAADWHVNESITLNVGLRYTQEKKRAQIARISAGGCNPVTLECNFTFNDKAKFDGWTPKVGFQWKPEQDIQLYGFWTKGFRSGGYNLRHTAPEVTPGPFDDERQNSFELGFKSDLADRRVRLNIALFHSKLKGLQREINTADPIVGVVQVIRNTADAVIYGVEADVSVQITPELTLSGNVGIVDGDYKKVIADLNRDGVIDERDKDLRIPRLAPLTYSIGASYAKPLGFGTLNARVNYSFRDDNFYTDANTLVPNTLMSKSDILDASVGVGLMDDKLTLSVYGRNLLNDVTENSISPLPPTFGGPGASLTLINKGRVYGASARYRF